MYIQQDFKLYTRHSIDCSPVLLELFGRWDCRPNLAMSRDNHMGARHMSCAYHVALM